MISFPGKRNRRNCGHVQKAGHRFLHPPPWRRKKRWKHFILRTHPGSYGLLGQEAGRTFSWHKSCVGSMGQASNPLTLKVLKQKEDRPRIAPDAPACVVFLARDAESFRSSRRRAADDQHSGCAYERFQQSTRPSEFPAELSQGGDSKTRLSGCSSEARADPSESSQLLGCWGRLLSRYFALLGVFVLMFLCVFVGWHAMAWRARIYTTLSLSLSLCSILASASGAAYHQSLALFPQHPHPSGRQIQSIQNKLVKDSLTISHNQLLSEIQGALAQPLAQKS